MKHSLKTFAALGFCVLFFCMCAFFSLGMLIPGASIAVEGAKMPQLIKDGRISDSFGDDFEVWFSKRFAFRGKIVDAFSSLRETLFHTGNEQVIVGTDGFLFFSDTLHSFLHTNPMTDEEIAAAATALESLSDYARQHGARLLFFAAPNKNTIYPEYMPARYRAAVPDTLSDLDRLYAYLSENTDVDYLDLRPVLTAAKTEGLLYHKRDSHWNGLGAHIAYQAIMEHLALPIPDYSGMTRLETERFEGDLDRLLYPGSVRYDANTTYDYSGLFVYTSAFSNEMDMVITARSAGKAGSLLFFRDSFGSALLGDCAISFSSTRFERAIPYRIDGLDTYAADVVLVEITERNLRELTKCAERISEVAG